MMWAVLMTGMTALAAQGAGDAAAGSAEPSAPEAFGHRHDPSTDLWDLHLGAEVGLSFTPRRRALFDYGLHARYTLVDYLSIGFGSLALGTAALGAGERWGLTGGPFLEVHHFVWSRGELFGRGNLPFQARWGAGMESRFGVAPSLAAGLRYWLGGRLALTASTRIQFVSSDSFLFPGRILPRETFIWMVSLGLEGAP